MKRRIRNGIKEVIYIGFLTALVLIGPFGLMFDKNAEADPLVKMGLIVATATFPLAVRYIYSEHKLAKLTTS